MWRDGRGDARIVVDAASAIGVVLWPGSPRCVSVERAAEILPTFLRD
jgi:phosphoribosylanthranilate isomerase